MTDTERDQARQKSQAGNDGQEQDGGESSEHQAQSPKQSKTSALEWVIAAVGALLVLGAAAVMVYEGVSSPDTPPQIEIRVDSVVGTDYGQVVEFRAINHGQQTAAGLVVEGELRSDTGTVEKAQVTIDYVPAEATRRGGLIFSHDPGRYTLDVRAKGYDRP